MLSCKRERNSELSPGGHWSRATVAAEQDELEEKLREKTSSVPTDEGKEVNIRDDSETIETIKTLISLCDRGLTKNP